MLRPHVSARQHGGSPFFRANRHEWSLEELKMTQAEMEEFAKVVAKLIRESAEVRQAIWDCACQCPNLTVEY